jgi:nucleotide-binding universal stress UspA family protein
MNALIAIDGSPESSTAVDLAAGLDWAPGSRLEILTVAPTDVDLYGGPFAAFEDFGPMDELHRRMKSERDAILNEAVARLGRDDLDVTARSPEGGVASTIVEEADWMSADLIILGARGHGAVERVLIGSTSSEVVDRAHCPVLVARGGQARRILVGTDGSDQAMSALSFVGESGLFRSAEVRVVHSVDLQPAWWLGLAAESASIASEAYDSALAAGREHAATVTSMARAALEATGLTVSTCVREGRPATVIVDEAATWHADLVVVGTRGYGMIKEMFLGSTARSVLQRSSTSVLIMRGSSTAPLVANRPAGSASAEPAHA